MAEEIGDERRSALLRDLDDRLAGTDALLASRYPGPPAGRQPVHTVYVPADRFDGATAARWGDAGAAALAAHGTEPATERALVAYLARGVGCGALDPDEVEV